MNHIVEVRYSGADWADLMADMRSWLDRRQIEAVEFNYSLLDRGVAVRVGLPDEDQAAAFATAFSGRLERSALSGAADPARNTIARSAGEDGIDLTAGKREINARAIAKEGGEPWIIGGCGHNVPPINRSWGLTR